MNIELHTDNLIIKKPSEEHLNSLIKELNNWKISQWLVNVPYPYTINDAQYWLKKTKEDDYSFNIFLKNKLIGGISITNKEYNAKPELGYWIGEDFWGKRYAHEACINLIQHFFFRDLFYRLHKVDNFLKNFFLFFLVFFCLL